MSEYIPRDLRSFNPFILDKLISDGNYEAQKAYCKNKIDTIGARLTTSVNEDNKGLARRMLAMLSHEMQISYAYGFITKTEMLQFQENFTQASYDANVANFFFQTIYEENGKISDYIVESPVI
jgi:hypothetical protein